MATFKEKEGRPHIKKFRHDLNLAQAASISYVLNVIKELTIAYPVQASKVKITDVQVTETYGHNDRNIVVKYIFVDKPQKGTQVVQLDDFTLQKIIDRYLS